MAKKVLNVGETRDFYEKNSAAVRELHEAVVAKGAPLEGETFRLNSAEGPEGELYTVQVYFREQLMGTVHKNGKSFADLDGETLPEIDQIPVAHLGKWVNRHLIMDRDVVDLRALMAQENFQ